jgi:hypothetical protein
MHTDSLAFFRSEVRGFKVRLVEELGSQAMNDIARYAARQPQPDYVVTDTAVIDQPASGTQPSDPGGGSPTKPEVRLVVRRRERISEYDAFFSLELAQSRRALS